MSENSACRGRQAVIVTFFHKESNIHQCVTLGSRSKGKKVFIIYYYECVLVIFFSSEPTKLIAFILATNAVLCA